MTGAMSVFTDDGACVYASGSHRCSGTSAIFIPRPVKMSTAPACTERPEESASRMLSTSAMFSVPVAKYTKPTPSR